MAPEEEEEEEEEMGDVELLKVVKKSEGLRRKDGIFGRRA